MKLASTLESVTVHRHGAVCVRTVVVPPAEVARLTVTGLPLCAVAGSLRARVVGDGAIHVLDVRAGFDVALGGEINLAAEARAHDEAEQAVGRISLAMDRLAREVAELEALVPEFRDPPKREGPREAPLCAMLELMDFVERRAEVLQTRRRALGLELEDARAREQICAARLRELGSAARISRAETTRTAVVTLSGAPQRECSVAVEYEVPGAAWAPTYQLALGEGGLGRLTMRASIAQRTGEDWTGVRLALSTASLRRRTAIPELRALRIGRAQPEPMRAGWREAPAGLDALFADFDAASVRHRPPPRPVPPARPQSAAASTGGMRRETQATLGAVSGAADGARPMPPPAAAPMMMSAPQAPSRAVTAEAETKRSAPRSRSSFGGPPGGDADEEASSAYDDVAAPEASEPLGPSGALLDYGGLQMQGPQGPARGRLAPAAIVLAVGVHVRVEAVVAAVDRAEQIARAVIHQAPPPGCVIASAHGRFDYRYEARAPADVPSTGAWTNVAIMECDVGLAPRYVCVPAVDPAVYRTLEVTNRSSHALLPGPVDVAQGGQFLLTTTLGAIGPGARGHRLGLGVEEAIKVARNTRYAETSGGLFGGKSVLQHGIDVDIENRLGVPIELEVRERVPVVESSEKHLEIEEGDVAPAWTAIDVPEDGVLVHGARRWRAHVAAGAKARLRAEYTIRIPADRTIVGGNRRS